MKSTQRGAEVDRVGSVDQLPDEEWDLDLVLEYFPGTPYPHTCLFFAQMGVNPGMVVADSLTQQGYTLRTGVDETHVVPWATADEQMKARHAAMLDAGRQFDRNVWTEEAE